MVSRATSFIRAPLALTALVALAFVLAFTSLDAGAQTKRAYLTRDAQTNQKPETCTETTSSEPPFYDLNSYDPAKDYLIPNNQARREVAGYIPKNSVVKIVSAREISLARLTGSDFVDIQVLSSPNEKTDLNARVSPSQIRLPVVGPGQRLGSGFRGAVQFRNLQPAGNLTYFVRRDAPALQIPGGELALAGRPIRLAKAMTITGSAYKVNRCCVTPPPAPDANIIGTVRDRLGLNDVCHDNYIFEILNSTTFCPMASVEIAAPNCDAFSTLLRPIDPSLGPAFAAISKMTGRGPESLEFIDSNGLVKIPVDPNTGRGPFGSLHHFKNPRPEPGNSLAVSYDAFLNAKSACAFMRVLEAFRANCAGPECEVQWNDAYHPFLINGTMSHASHTKDSCIDVFPLSKQKRAPSSITYGDASYDQARTFNLIELMIKAGADVAQMGFNDPEARRRYHTQNWPGHDNHIHVCFPNSPSRERPDLNDNVQAVNKTCSEGLIKKPAGSPPAASSVPASSPGLFGFLAPKCG